MVPARPNKQQTLDFISNIVRTSKTKVTATVRADFSEVREHFTLANKTFHALPSTSYSFVVVHCVQRVITF